MTTHIPRPPYTQEELQILYPPALELAQVHIFFRHGERTPVSQRLGNAGLAGFWPFCSVMGQNQSTVLLPEHPPASHNSAIRSQTLFWRKLVETQSSNSESPTLAYPHIRQGKSRPADAVLAGNGSICEQGMLTDRGRETTTALGQRLRQLYIKDLGFLPAVLTPSFAREEAFFRSTAVPRAMESLMQTIGGMWPNGHWDNTEMHAKSTSSMSLEKTSLGWSQAREATHDITPRTMFGSFPLDIVVRQSPDEDLYPNDWNCRRFAHLAREFADRAAQRWNNTPEMQYLTTKLGKWLPAGEVKLDGKPRLTGLMDTINATRAHDPGYLSKIGAIQSEKEGWDVFPIGRTQIGAKQDSGVSLPSEFYDPKAMDFIEQMAVDEWYSGFSESREYRMLGIGSLMGDVVERMVRGAETMSISKPGIPMKSSSEWQAGQQGNLRFSLNGCHDTTLAAILASLGAFDRKTWPRFTSHIAIELFRDPIALKSSNSASKSGFGFTTDDKPSTESTGRQGSHTGAIEKLEHLLHLHSQTTNSIGRRKIETLNTYEKERMKGYYVRLRFNDQPLVIPGCKPEGKHWRDNEGLCTLETFKAIIDQFTPDDWKEACRVKKNGNSDFPTQVEAAGYDSLQQS